MLDSSLVNSNFTKIPKPSAKQGDVSAAFGAQEFGQDEWTTHHIIYTKLFNQKLAAITALLVNICRNFAAQFDNFRRTLPHNSPFQASAAPHNLRFLAALKCCLCLIPM